MFFIVKFVDQSKLKKYILNDKRIGKLEMGKKDQLS